MLYCSHVNLLGQLDSMVTSVVGNRSFIVVLLFLTLICSLWQTAESHGFLLQPISRPYIRYKFNPTTDEDYTPHGANAGGKYKVHDDGKMQWPAGRWGMCGDPYDAPVKRLEQVENITANYLPGSIISLHLMITANHWGRMEFRLCPQDATTADYMQRCTILQREDGKGPHWTLPPGELPDPQGRPLIPTFQDNSFTWYIYPEQDAFKNYPTYVVKYKLPEGVTCEGCILHWYWLTGNSCNPPCELSDPLYPNCQRLQMKYCDELEALMPEEFWGCSDIHIGDADSRTQINSSIEELSQRLRSTHEDQAGDITHVKPQQPNKADHWRKDLLEVNDKLDEAWHNHTAKQPDA